MVGTVCIYCLLVFFLHITTDFFIDPKDIAYEKMVGCGSFGTIYKKGEKVALKKN